AMTTDGCRVILAERSDFKGDSGLASEGDGFLLDDLAADGEGVREVDLVEALRIGASGRIAVVDAVDVLDEAAASAELFGEEDRQGTGPAASEERAPAEPIACDKAGNNGDAADPEDILDGENVGADWLCVVRGCLGDELDLAGVKDLRGNAKAIEFERQERG